MSVWIFYHCYNFAESQYRFKETLQQQKMCIVLFLYKLLFKVNQYTIIHCKVYWHYTCYNAFRQAQKVRDYGQEIP